MYGLGAISRIREISSERLSKLDFTLYKAFRRLKVPGRKGFELASDILEMSTGGHWRPELNNAYRFIAKCKTVKTPPREIVNYIHKVWKSSGGGCWHCPGITLHQAYTTWCDYIDLAIGAGKLKGINPMPKDLHDAHNKMIKVKKHSGNRNKRWKVEYNKCFKAGENYAEKYKKKFPKVEKIYEGLVEKYSYENDKYLIVVPKTIQEIFAESLYLRLCVIREGVTRYWERVSKNDSYMMFLRKKESPEQPFYLIEVEPGGTIRQKRSFDDLQYADLDDAKSFLEEWQNVLRERMTDKDKQLARRSKKQRESDMDELRHNNTKVRSGYLTGQLLADVLAADLLEVEYDDIDDEEIVEVKAG